MAAAAGSFQLVLMDENMGEGGGAMLGQQAIAQLRAEVRACGAPVHCPLLP